MFNIQYIEQLQKKKSQIFDDMGKFPEREQELAEEYFSIDQEITNHYKNCTTGYSGGNAE